MTRGEPGVCPDGGRVGLWHNLILNFFSHSAVWEKNVLQWTIFMKAHRWIFYLARLEMIFQLVCVDSLFQLLNCLRFLRRLNKLHCPLASARSRIFLMGCQEVLAVQQLSIHQSPLNQTLLHPLLAFLLATCLHSFSHCICLCGIVLYPSLSLLSSALHFLLIVYLLIPPPWPSHRLAIGRCIFPLWK